jgi:hypothetical protein
MAKRFATEDLVSLALDLRQSVAAHAVPPKQRASLIEDIVFRFAVLVDEKTGSSLHESISGALRERAPELAASPEPVDSLVAEVEVVFAKGGKAELNVLRSSLSKPALLRQIVELALGVRDVTELRARVDVDRRFDQLMARRGGIKALRLNPAHTIGKPSWHAVALRRSPYGSFDQTLDGLVACIRAVTAPWNP